eukprot:7378841-Prymnesium_polylepis.2
MGGRAGTELAPRGSRSTSSPPRASCSVCRRSTPARSPRHSRCHSARDNHRLGSAVQAAVELAGAMGVALQQPSHAEPQPRLPVTRCASAQVIASSTPHCNDPPLPLHCALQLEGGSGDTGGSGGIGGLGGA